MILAALIPIYERDLQLPCIPPYIGWYTRPLNVRNFWSCCCSIRLASPSTKVEFEHCYFTNTKFTFDTPSHLRAFLDNLSIYQQSLLRYFELDLTLNSFEHKFPDDWMTCCTLLPPNLKSIKFGVWTWPWTTRKTGEEWFLGGDSSYYPVDNTRTSLNVLGKLARRCAAKAKIGLRDNSSGWINDDIEWFRVFDEVEPWGNDWLEWWEEDRKFDIAGIEPST